MASYDALINLRVKGLDQLSKVEKAVNNINGKGTSGSKSGSRRRLTEEEKIVKEKIKGLVAENRAIRTQTQQIGLKKKGIRFDETSKQLQEAISKAKGGQLDEANLLIQKATKAINLGKKELALENKTTKAVVNTNRAKSRGNRITKAAIRSGISSSVFGSAAQPGSPKFKASRAGMVQGPALPPVIQGPTSPIGGTRSMFGSPAQRAFSGGPRSPIRGTKSMAGSPAALAGLAGGKGSGVLQSALISGAFPLLFGQGPLGAIAGGLGGGIGAKMGGQMGGFAGGLVATAALQSITQAITGISNLGQALNPFTADIGKLTQALGLAGTAEGARLRAIEALSGKQAALAEATRLMNQQLGLAGTETLKVFGEKMKGVGNEFSKLMTKVGAVFADLILDTGILGFLEGVLKFINGIDMSKIKGLSQILLGAASFDMQGIQAGVKTMREGGSQGIEPGGTLSITQTGTDLFGKTFEKQEEKKQFLQDVLKFGKQKADLLKLEREEIKKIEDATEAKFDKDNELNKADLQRLKENAELANVMERQVALAEQLKSTLSEGLSSAIEGLITGAKSLQESFSNILKSFGSILLRTGMSNMMGGLNFGKFFGQGIGGSAEGNYLANGIRPFASGGMVTRPTMGLVGEAGEDEYDIPASKMASSMQRYSAGARGQAVIPGTGSSSSGGVAGSSTNVTYSGPILNFNSEEFIPKSAIGQIINSAASKGAAAGESRTMSTLRNSRSARSRIGM